MPAIVWVHCVKYILCVLQISKNKGSLSSKHGITNQLLQLHLSLIITHMQGFCCEPLFSRVYGPE